MFKRLIAAGFAGTLFAAAGSVVLAQPPAADAPAAKPSPEQIAKGAVAFQQRCKDCHDPAVGEAPEKAALAMRDPDEIFMILKSGLMQPMADGLSDADMHAIAAYLTAAPAK